MYVCLCKGITDTQIKQAVAEGAESLRAVNKKLGTASQCGKCGMMTKDIVMSALAEQSQQSNDWFYDAAIA